MSGKYALIIGNTDYIDSGLAQLTAPGKDAEDFARVLKDPNICGFDEVRILLNEPSSTVIETIDEFFDQRKPDDLIVLFFSGHGVRDEAGSLYLAVKNTIRSRLRSTAVKSDYIREVMDQSRSRRQVLILDCCNSGAFAQGTKADIGGMMGLVSAFQGYGRYVLTASDATQFAWEGNQVIGETDNSLFTHFLIKGLEGDADNDGDGKITVDELYDYAFEQIISLTPKQKPNKSATKQEGEIVLRQITRLEDIKPISLPDELTEATQDSRTFVREGAVLQLEKLLKGKNLGLVRSAREALERMEREDDSRRVSQAATQVLKPIRELEQQAEEERRAREEAERQAKIKAEEERLSAEKVAAEKKQSVQRFLAEQRTEEERKIREKAEQLAILRAREEQLAREQTEAERKSKEKAAQQVTAEVAEHERIAQPATGQYTIEGQPVTEKAVRRQQPILKWAVISIIMLFVIAGSAWGISYFAGGPATPTQSPIQGTNVNPPAVSTESSQIQPSTQSVQTENPTPVTIDCMGAKSGDEVSMLYQWSGVEETNLNTILQPLVDACGIVLKPESTRDQGLLDTRVQAGNPPDIVFWNVAQLVQYQDKLKTMDSLGAHKENYADFFIDPGTINGKWLGLPVKADVKTIIWYSPANFQSLGYTVPTTWDELNALVDKMATDGHVPWSMGFESGGATGWPGSDFIQDILLVQQGPEYVMNIINGTTSYNDAGVKQAYETYGKWATDPKYTVGGAQGTLSTHFLQAIYQPFADPPEAMMVKQSGFAGAEIVKLFPDFNQGTDYDFFVVPGAKGLQGGADWMMAFSDKPALKALVAYLSSTQGGTKWAATTFGLSPNKGASGNYTDPALQKLDKALSTTTGFTPDIGDTIPGGFGSAEFNAIADYVNGGDLNSILNNLAAKQKEALKE